MEFVSYDEAMDVLGELGVIESIQPGDMLQLSLADSDEVVHLHLVPPELMDCAKEARRTGATVLSVEKSRLPELIEHLIHKLGLTQVLLLPLGKWRRVFDAVAFSLASNVHWREIDATASLALNTRDPLLCEPPDLHTLRDLIAALVKDAEQPDQGIMITSTSSPLMVELHPNGTARISVGSIVLADEIIRTFGAASRAV